MAQKFEFKIVDNSKEIIKATDEQIRKALEECGQLAEGYAKLDCPVKTGNLRNSITHVVDDKTMLLGTAVEYGIYVEMGTGSADGVVGGRQTVWVYQDDEGHFWKTKGHEPRPFIKPAIANHIDTYKQVLQDNLHT